MLLEVKNVSFRYGKNSPWILKDISFGIEEGERVAIEGPSGCGKSTLSAILAGYLKPTAGQVLFDGHPLPEKGYCPVQMIFQHPEKSVNPRWKMGRTLREAWEPDDALLERLGIEAEWLSRWPSELSGGELQRFCIARVLGQKTRFLIADEISTMLDVITQAQIWQVLLNEAAEKKCSMAVITHNPHLAARVCGRIIRLPEINGADASGAL